MSKCDLTIVFDDPSRRFSIGDRVTGHVEVRVNKSCTCKRLNLTRLWKTHGSGNQNRGGIDRQILFIGSWEAGRTYTYPFQFEVEAAPSTYHGHHVNLDHYVEVDADLPWAFDPHAEEEFIVASCTRRRDFRVGDGHEDGSSELENQGSLAPGCMLPILAVFWLAFGPGFLLAGLAVMSQGGAALLQGNPAGLLMSAMGIPFAAVGGGVIFFSLRKKLAETKLGKVRATLEPQRAHPGQEVVVNLDFSPRSRAKINKISATLKGTESATSGSGSSATTHTHEVFLQEDYFRLDRADLLARERVELSLTFKLPRDAPYTLTLGSNTLAWSLSLHIDVANWPDWTEDRVFIVQPAPPARISLTKPGEAPKGKRLGKKKRGDGSVGSAIGGPVG
jgi:hypothetical protein